MDMLDRLIAEEQKVLDDLTSGAGRSEAPSILTALGGAMAPQPSDYETTDQYRRAYRVWASVRDTGKQVGSEPAPENAEHGADRGDGAE